jgi:Holliday junction resolvasome RuvABC endonuclease subunit
VKCVGIDPSSSCTAAALVEGKALLDLWAWMPSKQESEAQRLHNFYMALKSYLRPNPFEPPIAPMACIEFLSVTRNMNAVRAVSHYQAASVLACKMAGLVVIEARVSSARKVVVGKGNMPKEEVYAEMKRRYPEFDWGRLTKNGKGATNGGMDKSDATVLGLAGPSIAER